VNTTNIETMSELLPIRKVDKIRLKKTAAAVATREASEK